MIAENTIQQILNAARIEEVVGDYVQLKKRGINYIGNCPFHQEKTPSFTVSPVKGIYKCFGCGKAGNVTKFMMDQEHMTYQDALEYLAKKYNIAFESKPLTAQQIIEQKERDVLLQLHQIAKEYFTEQLWNTDEGKTIGGAYFKERQLRDEIIRKFDLGYNPDTEKAFTTFALSKGFDIELLKKSGLSTQQRSADFFRGRVIFPIHNTTGKVIAFGARTLKKEKNIAKYFNSPETEIYHKSKVLYGLYQAKNAIAKNNFSYLVEGYLDVISLHQGGIENVVASSGTALTIEQIRLIKRYTPNVVLLYDSDAAGIKAALRGMELLIEEGLNLKLALLPEGEDPDSYIHKNSAQAFEQYVQQNAKDFIKFKIQLSINEAKSDPYKKATITKELIQIFAKIPDSFVRSEYTKEFCEMLNISEELVIREVNNLMREQIKKSNISDLDANQLYDLHQIDNNAPQPTNFFKGSISEEQEKNIIRILLEWGNKTLSDGQLVANVLAEEIEVSLMENILYAKIFNQFLQQLNEQVAFDAQIFINSNDKEIAELAVNLLSQPYDLSPNWEAKHHIFIKDREVNFEADVKSSIHHFKLKKLLSLIDENMKQIKAETNPQELVQYKHVHMQLALMKSTLAKVSGTAIIKK